MDDTFNLRNLYQDLAEGYAARGQPQFRDRFLVLAAAAALDGGDPEAAEQLRQRLLAVNPHHLLKPYGSFARALQMADVQEYLNELRKDYPPAVSIGMLRSLRELNESEPPPIPMTAPLLDLGGGPDLLMDDDAEPLKILSLRDESPSGIPPTLPPEKIARAAERQPPRHSIPQTLFDAELPPELPRVPRPRATRVATPPAPVSVPKPIPHQPARRPEPVPTRTPMPNPERSPAPVAISPIVQPPEPESEVIGAWVCIVLFVVAASAGLALLSHSLLLPILSRS
jgi:hypothetical protein